MDEEQEEMCATCYGLKGDYLPFCQIYREGYRSGNIEIGDRCPVLRVLDRDLEKFVLDYPCVYKGIVDIIMANPPDEYQRLKGDGK